MTGKTAADAAQLQIVSKNDDSTVVQVGSKEILLDAADAALIEALEEGALDSLIEIPQGLIVLEGSVKTAPVYDFYYDPLRSSIVPPCTLR